MVRACPCVTSIRIRSVAPYIGPPSAGRSRLGLAYGLRIAPRIDPWLYRATGGRYPSILGTVASAPLMTTGAKSGQPREVQLSYFHDGPDPILIANVRTTSTPRCGGPVPCNHVSQSP